MKEADQGMLWLCIENIVPSMTCGISLTCAMNYLTIGHFLKEKTYCIQIYATNTTLKKKKKWLTRASCIFGSNDIFWCLTFEFSHTKLKNKIKTLTKDNIYIYILYGFYSHYNAMNSCVWEVRSLDIMFISY